MRAFVVVEKGGEAKFERFRRANHLGNADARRLGAINSHRFCSATIGNKIVKNDLHYQAQQHQQQKCYNSVEHNGEAHKEQMPRHQHRNSVEYKKQQPLQQHRRQQFHNIDKIGVAQNARIGAKHPKRQHSDGDKNQNQRPNRQCRLKFWPLRIGLFRQEIGQQKRHATSCHIVHKHYPARHIFQRSEVRKNVALKQLLLSRYHSFLQFDINCKDKHFSYNHQMCIFLLFENLKIRVFRLPTT